MGAGALGVVIGACDVGACVFGAGDADGGVLGAGDSGAAQSGVTSALLSAAHNSARALGWSLLENIYLPPFTSKLRSDQPTPPRSSRTTT